MTKSLLRYPGGKTRAVKKLLPFFPDGVELVCSPFLGGGSLEIALANKGIKVRGYDKFKPLVCFWQTLLKDKDNLYHEVEKIHSKMSKSFFKESQKKLSENINKWTDLEIASYFYALNRSSFSGTVLSGGYSTPNHPRFNKQSIDRILNFSCENLQVEMRDFTQSIEMNEECFLYCDPPYLLDGIKNKLYGNRGDLHEAFDHQKLLEILSKRKNWILSYNNSEVIREMYSEYEIVYPEWKYGMSKEKDSKEVLIINY